MFNFSKACKVDRLMTAQAAGQTLLTGESIDTKGFLGVAFIASMGAITAGAVTSLKAQQSSDDAAGDAFADLEDTAVSIADDDDNKLVILDVFKPRERYVRPLIVRGTQNAAVDGIVAVLYGATDEPVSQPADVAATEFHQSPAEGTA